MCGEIFFFWMKHKHESTSKQQLQRAKAAEEERKEENFRMRWAWGGAGTLAGIGNFFFAKVAQNHVFRHFEQFWETNFYREKKFFW